MAAYINVSDVETRCLRSFSTSETAQIQSLIEQAGAIVDAYNCSADFGAKQIVSLNMVSRLVSNMDNQVPIGATQGSMSGLGYSQSWTISSGGANGEMYLTKLDKKLLGVGSKIGASNPFEGMVGG